MKTDWELRKLGKVSAINYGYTESSSVEPIGPRFLRITDIQDDRVDWENVPYCKIESADLPKYSLASGDIVFARTGATTGKSFLVDDPPEAVFASYLIRLRLLDNKLLPKFVSLFFQSAGYWKSIKDGSVGSAQGGFNASKLAALSLPVPPIPEQQRIVSILDETFDSIATAKANAEKNLQNARSIFESHLQSVFTKRGEGWEEKTLDQISENLDSKRVPITKNIRDSGSVPYYGASGVVDYVKDYLFDEDLLCVSEDGANLLARTYPIAFSISGKTWVNNHAHVLRFKNTVSQRFVEVYLNSIKLDDFVSGMAQPKLNQAMLNKIPVPFPSLLVQENIVVKLDNLRAETQRLESIYQQKLVMLEALKKSLLHQAFSGEL